MRKSASRPDTENPEWTAEDMRRARPALEVLPKEVIDAIRRHQAEQRSQKTTRARGARRRAASGAKRG